MSTGVKKKNNFKNFINILSIVGGSLLSAIGIQWFIKQNGLVTGGVTGLSIIVSDLCQKFFGVLPSLGLINFLLSIPIFVFSYFVSGMKLIKKSFLVMILSSFWLAIIKNPPEFLNLNGDLFPSIICGGILNGLGIGLILKSGASSGGMDMLSNDLNKLFPQFPIPNILFISDFSIISAGLFLFTFKSIVFSIVMSFIYSRLINSLLGGLRFARTVFIFSEKTDEISNQIFAVLSRGNTQIRCKGMYSKQTKHMLMVVVLPKEISKLKEAIERVDKNAFVTICPAQEVLGKGF